MRTSIQKEQTKPYDADFYAWTIKNARLMREGKWAEVDIEHIAEEIESIGRSEKRELINRFSILLSHLLKWKYQPAKRTRNWKNAITTQRIDITDLLEDSPSLKYEIGSRLEKAYLKAKLIAEDETGIEQSNFPKQCPFSTEDVLAMEFFPDRGETV